MFALNGLEGRLLSCSVATRDGIERHIGGAIVLATGDVRYQCRNTSMAGMHVCSHQRVDW